MEESNLKLPTTNSAAYMLVKCFKFMPNIGAAIKVILVSTVYIPIYKVLFSLGADSYRLFRSSSVVPATAEPVTKLNKTT